MGDVLLMRLSDRFIDYALTGAFFLIGQIILLVVWNLVGWIHGVGVFLTQLPMPLQTPSNEVLTVLGIISIEIACCFTCLHLKIYLYNKCFDAAVSWDGVMG